MTTTRVLASELGMHIGQQVTLSGWLHRRRELKSVTFLQAITHRAAPRSSRRSSPRSASPLRRRRSTCTGQR
ncbi:MAG TPA: hypothetical protein VN695_16310 [Streptosporangiaceae bacterium]|nr:hypothetical protein [Streptosporangiaceae bacterium]